MSNFIAAMFLMVALAAISLLVSGPSYLEAPLPGGLPIGNVLAELAFSTPAGAAIALSQPRTWLRRIAATTFMVGLAWLPISIALAGNLVLNFNGSRGSVWLGFTLAIALAVFGVVGWALINRLLRGLLRARSSSKAA
jgi:hypothetical protein